MPENGSSRTPCDGSEIDEQDFLRAAQKSMYRKKWQVCSTLTDALSVFVYQLLKAKNLIFAGASLEIVREKFQIQ